MGGADGRMIFALAPGELRCLLWVNTGGDRGVVRVSFTNVSFFTNKRRAGPVKSHATAAMSTNDRTAYEVWSQAPASASVRADGLRDAGINTRPDKNTSRHRTDQIKPCVQTTRPTWPRMAVSVDFHDPAYGRDEERGREPKRSASSVDSWTGSSVVGAGASSKGSSSGAAPSSGSALAMVLSWAAGVPALADGLGAQVRDRVGERTAGRTRGGTCPWIPSVIGRAGFEREPKNDEPHTS